MQRLSSLPLPTRPLLLPTVPAPLLAFATALVWFGFLAWLRPLAMPDEGRYAGVALEMLRSGNWITPTIDGLPFLHKPPLFYWIAAAAMHLFGVTAWAARLPSMLAASVALATVYAVSLESSGPRVARIAVVVLATQPLYFGGAQFANMDMLVAGCISVCILLAARAALRIERGAACRGDLIGAYVAAGLGVLAKGLIGLVLPGLVLLVWLGLVGHWRTLRALLWWPGAAIFAVIVLPWFAAVQWENPAFLHYFLVVQQFARYTGGGFNNAQPVWFYVPVLLLTTLPWSGWLWPTLQRSFGVRSTQPAIASLMWIWLAVVVLFFSLPQSKLIGYVLPALVPMAVLVALTAAPLLDRSAAARRVWKLTAAVAACLCIGVTIGFALRHAKSSRGLTADFASGRPLREGLAFIDEFRYDVPVYLRDTAPIVVVSDWSPERVRRQDNWRHELLDAGSFAPQAAAGRLVGAAAFHDALCAGRVRWVMAPLQSSRLYPLLSSARLVANDPSGALWQVDRLEPRMAAALACKPPAVIRVTAR